jgi:hypothetical protein
MTDEQLAAVRRCTSDEVVKMLNIPAKWLKELVREGRVPHQRTGPTKGVWFTAEDVLNIGEMLPELMSHGRTSAEAPPADGQPDDGVPPAAGRGGTDGAAARGAGAVDSAPADTQAYEGLTGALAVVLRELDDLERTGRNPQLRETAKKPTGG